VPTTAPRAVYDPDGSKAQIKPFTDIAVPLLKEVLNYGLALFARCSIRPEGDDENLMILFTYRHLLEMLDSVLIQIAECSPAPAALQLRAMFEALLTLEYVTSDKSKTRQRALAYLYQVERQRRTFYLTLDPNTPEGKTLLEYISSDPYSKDFKPAQVPDLAERLKEIDDLVDTPDLQVIANEYRRTRKTLKRQPHWYSLYDGPTSIKDLARLLKRGASYAILYKEWSERTHSVDAIDRSLTHDSSGPSARPLRDATELNYSVDFAITFAIAASRCLIGTYRPDEEPAFSNWIATEIMPNWKRIPKIEIKGLVARI
jgi:hypothetical protein